MQVSDAVLVAAVGAAPLLLLYFGKIRSADQKQNLRTGLIEAEVSSLRKTMEAEMSTIRKVVDTLYELVIVGPMRKVIEKGLLRESSPLTPTRKFYETFTAPEDTRIGLDLTHLAKSTSLPSADVDLAQVLVKRIGMETVEKRALANGVSVQELLILMVAMVRHRQAQRRERLE